MTSWTLADLTLTAMQGGVQLGPLLKAELAAGFPADRSVLSGLAHQEVLQGAARQVVAGHPSPVIQADFVARPDLTAQEQHCLLGPDAPASVQTAARLAVVDAKRAASTMMADLASQLREGSVDPRSVEAAAHLLKSDPHVRRLFHGRVSAHLDPAGVAALALLPHSRLAAHALLKEMPHSLLLAALQDYPAALATLARILERQVQDVPSWGDTLNVDLSSCAAARDPRWREAVAMHAPGIAPHGWIAEMVAARAPGDPAALAPAASLPAPWWDIIGDSVRASHPTLLAAEVDPASQAWLDGYVAGPCIPTHPTWLLRAAVAHDPSVAFALCEEGLPADTAHAVVLAVTAQQADWPTERMEAWWAAAAAGVRSATELRSPGRYLVGLLSLDDRLDLSGTAAAAHAWAAWVPTGARHRWPAQVVASAARLRPEFAAHVCSDLERLIARQGGAAAQLVAVLSGEFPGSWGQLLRAGALTAGQDPADPNESGQMVNAGPKNDAC